MLFALCEAINSSKNRRFLRATIISNLTSQHNAKRTSRLGDPFYMELMTRFELVTSSLPRMRSTY